MKSQDSLPSLINPKLIVFDLDFTLWECGGTWCDCLTPPFLARDGKVLDHQQAEVKLYCDVGKILNYCDEAGIGLAIASRTEQPEWARQLLCLLQIDGRFHFSEIYPTDKVKHFTSIRHQAGIEYHEMLFFDDELRNIHDVKSLGVISIHVSNGMTFNVLKHGLREFQKHFTEDASEKID